MNLSVVVCAKNSEKTIRGCLESVQFNNPSEIIVIDGKSTDSTVQITDEFTEKVYSDERKGLAFARQLGSEEAVSEYLVYVDSDVVLLPDSLARMLENMRQGGYTGLHAQVISLENRSYWEWAEDQHFQMMFNREEDTRFIGTIAAIFRRDAVMEYKFDPVFLGAAKDHDLCHRLRKDSHSLGISSAFAYHQHRATIKSFVKQRIWYGRGNAVYIWRHKSPMALLGPSL